MKCAHTENVMGYQIPCYSLHLYTDKDTHTSNYTSLTQSWMPSSGVTKMLYFLKSFPIKKNTSNDEKVNMDLIHACQNWSCMLVRLYFSEHIFH